MKCTDMCLLQCPFHIISTVNGFNNFFISSNDLFISSNNFSISLGAGDFLSVELNCCSVWEKSHKSLLLSLSVLGRSCTTTIITDHDPIYDLVVFDQKNFQYPCYASIHNFSDFACNHLPNPDFSSSSKGHIMAVKQRKKLVGL